MRGRHGPLVQGQSASTMSLLTEAFLLEKYGSQRLTMGELAEVLRYKTRGTIYNKVSAGTFPIPTYVGEDGRRYADARHVAEYLDQCREEAKK